MGSPSPSVSLLLARAIVGLTGRTSDDVIVWLNVLQHLDGAAAPVGLAEMRERSCLSKRALITAFKRCARDGLVTLSGSGVGLAATLTPAGEAAAVERRPEDPRGVKALRSALVSAVASLPLEHPHHPTQYGTADSSLTGGRGQDWKPVERMPGGGGVEALPLLALLSQAFCALAITYEFQNGALGWAANVLVHVPDKGAAVSALPRSAVPLSGMERHGMLQVVDGRVTLTSLGRTLRGRHDDVLASIEGEAGWPSSVRAPLAAFVDGFGSSLDDVFHPRTASLFGYGR
jgi:hypothetical protein